MLVDFYESGIMDESKDLVYGKGIDGIDFCQNECQDESEEASPTMTL